MCSIILSIILIALLPEIMLVVTPMVIVGVMVACLVCGALACFAFIKIAFCKIFNYFSDSINRFKLKHRFVKKTEKHTKKIVDSSLEDEDLESEALYYIQKFGDI